MNLLVFNEPKKTTATGVHIQAHARPQLESVHALPNAIQFHRKVDGAGIPALSMLQLQQTVGNRTLADIAAKDDSPVQRKANQTGMPDDLKEKLESQSGMDLSDVKVHYNSSRPSKLGAYAFAQGNQIHVAPGQEKHLPHEVWHVVQQRQGRVKPSRMLEGGVAVNDDPLLEKEADEMGARVIQRKRDWRLEAPVMGDSFKDGRAEELRPTADHASVVQLNWIPLSDEGNIFLTKVISFLKGTLALDKLKQSATANMTGEINPILLEVAALVKSKENLEETDKKTIKEKTDEIRAHELEHKEGGHSLARHGPAVDDTKLKKRLYTGIAPDGKFSPAPGASSQFVSYEAVLATRQAAADELKTVITEAQAKVLEWKKDVMPGLQEIAEKKRIDKETKADDKKKKEQDLAKHKKDDLEGKQHEVDQLNKEKEPLLVELVKIEKELESGRRSTSDSGIINIFEDDEEVGEELSQQELNNKRARKIKIEAELDEIDNQLQEPQAALEVSKQTESRLAGELESSARSLGEATAAHETAVDEANNPGKNLKKYLHDNQTVELEVMDKAGKESFKDTVKMVKQYSIVVQHSEVVGKGFEGTDDKGNKVEVKLTDVLKVATKNPEADDPEPKSKEEIISELKKMDLTEELDSLADRLANRDELKLIKAKAEMGGKIYKQATAVSGLNRTFTNYEVKDTTLFDDDDKAKDINVTDWPAIQHFPVKDADLGVKEKA